MTNNFKKKQEIIICIDSDGCAMDTMNIKHEKCFGPLVVEIFRLTEAGRFLDIWNKINLYSQTRGINRFKGLVLSLQQYGYTGDFSQLSRWAHEAKELSNLSLEKEIEKNTSLNLQLALKWSKAVNTLIKAQSEQYRPFDGVLEALVKLHQFVDIAVVSSANNAAIYDEWEHHKLLAHVDIVFGQDQGSKLFCLNEIKKYAYSPNNILMVGDSPGDLQAAQGAGVHFFPIIGKQEKESWQKLTNIVLPKLQNKKFDADYQMALISEFNDSLN